MKKLSVLDYEQLKEYAELEGSELGEVNILLLQIINYRDYVSDEFKKALEKEMKTQLKYFKQQCKIITREVKVTTKLIKELSWN